jgi:hypothetical protein
MEAVSPLTATASHGARLPLFFRFFRRGQSARRIQAATVGVLNTRPAMLEELKDMPQGIDGLKAVGKLSKEDYEKVMVPLLDGARREGRRLRLLYQLGPEFEGFTASAAWEDARVGIHYMRLFDACAVVTDLGWVREATKLARFLLPCPVGVFANQERDKATDWLRSLPQVAAITFRLLPDAGVIVVEVTRALRAQDFDALALTADTWIDAHGSLGGLVIHARKFPGWENFGGLLRHVRFVRDHHRKVERVALAVDGELAALAPRIGEHFVKAEVKSFGYSELDAAIAWASGPAGRTTSPRTS